MALVLGQPVKVSMLYLGQYEVDCYFATGPKFDKGLFRLQSEGRTIKRSGNVKLNRDVYVSFFDAHCERVEGVSIANPKGDPKVVDVMEHEDWQAKIPPSLKTEAVIALSTRGRLDEEDEED